MRKLGQKHLTLELRETIAAVPETLAKYQLTLTGDGTKLVYTYDTQREAGVINLLEDLRNTGLHFKDLVTTERSLEDIFVDLVRQR
jgi:ABC-2 type transport system ATP-binding protein